MQIIPNQHGIYNKYSADVFTAKNTKCTVKIYLLHIADGWLSSGTTSSYEQSHSGPLAANRGLFDSKKEAFDNAINNIKKLGYVGDNLLKKLQMQLEHS